MSPRFLWSLSILGDLAAGLLVFLAAGAAGLCGVLVVLMLLLPIEFGCFAWADLRRDK